jgi:hypothetical protein
VGSDEPRISRRMRARLCSRVMARVLRVLMASGRMLLLACVLSAGLVTSAAADAEPSAEDLPKREAPDYDGRPESTSAGEVLLWVPRILLSPFYLVSEYVVRRPLGFLLTTAEQAHVPEALYSLFTFGVDHKAGILPIAFVEFGFDPSVGLYFFWDDAFVNGHDLRMSGSTWGDDWLAGGVTSRFDLPRARGLELEATAVRRPDFRFYGLGPDAPQEALSRYGANRFDVHTTFEQRFFRSSRFALTLGLRDVGFHRGHYDDDPTLGQQVAAGVFETPPGYPGGYTNLYNRVFLAIDSRRPRPAPGSGVRVQLVTEQQSDLAESPESGFVRYGMSAGGFYDLNDHGRVVSLSGAVLFADPLGSQPIPFTELATIGGDESMRGFPDGRLYDRSAALLTLRYRYPIWILLDGSIQVAVGNVFGEHLQGFSATRLRFSAAIGIESVGSPDSSFELLFGIGSEPFDLGGDITSVRIALGTNHGF